MGKQMMGQYLGDTYHHHGLGLKNNFLVMKDAFYCLYHRFQFFRLWECPQILFALLIKQRGMIVSWELDLEDNESMNDYGLMVLIILYEEQKWICALLMHEEI